MWLTGGGSELPREQEFVEGVGLRVNVEFQDIPRSSPRSETVWGSAYTGFLSLKLRVSPPTTHPLPQPHPATRDNTGLLRPQEGRIGFWP